MHLDKSNELPCNEIYNLHQDRQGFIWIASDLGLFRYDGFEYRPYVAAQMSSKSGSYIREDYKGRIWYSTFDARLYFVENDTLKPFEAKTTFSQTLEYAILGERLFALGQKNELLIIDINNGRLLKKLAMPDLFSSLYQVDSLFELGDGKTQLLLNAEAKVIRKFSAEPGNCILKVIPAGEKYFSAETKGLSLMVYEIGRESKKIIYQEPLSEKINGFFLIDSQLFLLKNQGITQIDSRNYRSQTKLLSGQNASHVIKDRNGFLWISTAFDGIFTFPSAGTFIAYDLPLYNGKIRILAGDFLLFNTSGEIWTFSWHDFTLRQIYTDETKSVIYDVVPFPQGFLQKLSSDENFSTIRYQNVDLLILKSGVKEIQKIDSAFMAIAMTGVAGLQQINPQAHSIWGQIARRYRDTLFYPQRDLILGRFADNVRTKSVCFDPHKEMIYFATNTGLITVTPQAVNEAFEGSNKIYAAKLFTYNQRVYAFLHSGEILTKESNDAFLKNEKLNIHAPYQFFRQQDSVLFLGTGKELFYVNLLDTASTFRQIPFSMPISELNDIVLFNNYFYLSVKNQLIGISKQSIAPPHEIPFYINYIESNVGRYYKVNGLQLQAKEKDIRINFSALDFFRHSPSIQYRVNQQDWQKVGNGSRSIALASLSPDSYTISFLVNGKLYDNIVQFSISKPWYVRTWFLLLVLSSVSLLAYFYYRRRLAANRKETDLLLEKANLEKDLRQSMLSSIKSQMNPHFLFNALNTIQSYIITEDKANASNYLSKFSKLTRKILEMSD